MSLLLIPQDWRRHWYDGYKSSGAVGSLVYTIIRVFTSDTLVYEYGYKVPDPQLYLEMLVVFTIFAVLWLPFAWLTWRPYVPIPPPEPE
jgi:hypothetical protein